MDHSMFLISYLYRLLLPHWLAMKTFDGKAKRYRTAMIHLWSFEAARNLLPCKRKNHLGRWFDRRL